MILYFVHSRTLLAADRLCKNKIKPKPFLNRANATHQESYLNWKI